VLRSRDAPAPGGRGSSTYENSPVAGRVGTALRAGPYRDHQRGRWQFLAVLLGAYLLGAVAFWAWFRFRQAPERSSTHS
jgi:hypothetical protein